MSLDLSQFHKIETDDHSTTLEHKSGHKLKIVHKALSSDMRKKLEDIPVKMAKGGYAKFSQKYDPNFQSKASKASKSSNNMPGSPTEAKDAYTEPDTIGTSIPKGQLAAQMHGEEPYDDVVINALNRKAPPYGPLGSDEKQHYPPCVNPSCKSFGRSHPNCRCYGGSPEGGHFAEGGKVDSYCSKDQKHQEGCEYFKAGGVAMGDEPGEAPQEVQEATPAPPADAPVNPNPEGGQSAPADVTPASPDSVPAQDPQDPTAQPAQAPQNPMDAFDQKKQAAAQDMYPEAQAFSQDLDNGHITPETYKDLFDKKDTLGKIGTLFGLLVGGVGSGLTGQPNVILGMMNKEIERDLDAQKTSSTNKQNFLKINQGNVSTKAQAGALNIETQTKAYALSRVQMNNTALHSLVQNVQKMPPGPQRDQAMNTLAMMNKDIQNENFNIMDRAATASALSGVLNNGSGGGANGMPNTTAMKSGLLGPEAKEAGQDIENKTIPGIKGRAQIPVPQATRDEVQAMKVLSDKAQDLIGFAKQHTGTLSPSQKAIAQQKADEMVNFYNNSIKGGVLTEGRLKWFDDQIKKNPTGIVTQLMGNNARLQEIMDSNNHRRDLLLQQYGFPKQKASSGQSAPSSGGEIERMDPKSGKVVIYDANTKKPLRYK